jgi:hypothetical protein
MTDAEYSALVKRLREQMEYMTGVQYRIETNWFHSVARGYEVMESARWVYDNIQKKITDEIKSRE